MEWSVIFPILATVINLIVLAAGGVWFLARMEARQITALAKHREEINHTINEIRSLVLNQGLVLRQEFGDTIFAIRHKIHEIEMWIRDNFLRQDLYIASEEKIEKRLEQLDQRLIDLRELFLMAREEKKND